MTALSDSLSNLAQSLPASMRKKVYKTVKIAAAVATVALVLLPLLPSVGVEYDTTGLAAVLAAVLALVGHLADSNLHPLD